MAGKRKYSCNYNYFNTIDSCEKAYWLGFILADGCVIKSVRQRKLKTCTSTQTRYLLQITLSSADYDHLVKFKKCISSNHPIKCYKTSGFATSRNCVRVVIEDRGLVEDLVSCGIEYNKQLKERYLHDIPSEFDKDFIRGIFDGDGCLSEHKNKYGNPEYEFSFTGTRELLTDIAIKMDLLITSKRLKQRFPERCINNFTMKFCGTKQTEKAMDYLYSNATIYLDRKYQKYQKLKNYLNSRSK